MKFNCYCSEDDNGQETIATAVTLQPDTVLGLAMLAYPNTPNQLSPTDSTYDTLKDFANEWAADLSKYQIGVLLHHARGDVFDMTATLFHMRYPDDILNRLAVHIPNVPVMYSSTVPKDIQTISDVHSLPHAVKRNWVIGSETSQGYQQSLRHELEHLSGLGLRAKCRH